MNKLGGKDYRETEWAKELLALPEGWNSHGAKRITTEALRTIGEFFVVPRSNGGVQLELHCGGYDVEIEISPGGEVEGVYRRTRKKRASR